MEGWIKLHRKLQEKALWQCTTPEQKVILITILLNINSDEKEWEWQGKQFICEPGQMVTSLASLAEKCGKGITVQNVRTALEKFEKYGFLTNQSTKTGRLITVVNWAFYQDSSCEATKQPTKHQQSSNKEVTTNKNNKNNKNNWKAGLNFTENYKKKLYGSAQHRSKKLFLLQYFLMPTMKLTSGNGRESGLLVNPVKW